jgi:hypothetical protein
MTALRKILLCPYFGPLPEWWDSYRVQVDRMAEQGYDFFFFHDLEKFKRRVAGRFNVICPIQEGDSKIHDYRAAFGLLFADELVGYDFWGHTDFDCVYGRPAHFMPDERLAELDVHSDHWSYLCGPWTLYRNDPTLNEAFMDVDGWKDRLEDPVTSGWVEMSFTEHVNSLGLRVAYELFHGWQHDDSLRWEGEALWERGREISFFHFRRSKAWPVIA